MVKRRCYYMAHPNIGDTHQILNVSMLMMLCRIYDEVVVYAPFDCVEDLKEQMSKLDSKHMEKIIYRYNRIISKSQFPFWMCCGLQTLVSLFKTRKGEDIFFSTLNWLCFPLFNTWSALTKRRIFTLCHNDLEHLLKPKFGSVNVHWHMIRYIFKHMSFAKANFLLVLGDSVKDNLKKILQPNLVNNHVLSICHPYYTKGNIQSSYGAHHKGWKIGIAGTVKDSDLSGLALLNDVLVNHPNMRVFNISTTNSDISQFKQVTNLNHDNKHIPRIQYDEILQGMDILYFPYPSTAYQVSASGAVYEAIMKEKPILAASNPYFEWLFRKFGKMGLLFHDRQELEKYMDKLESEVSLCNFNSSMKEAKKYIDPSNYWIEFKHIINSIRQ